MPGERTTRAHPSGELALIVMPFRRGNPGGAYTTGVPKPQHADVRKAARSLAMSIRDGLHPDEARDWLLAVWRGKDPLTGEVVPIEVRERALKALMDRGWGQAAQMLVVEGQITNEIIATTETAARPVLTLEQINTRRAALRAALPEGSVGTGRVLDAMSTEVKSG